MQFGGPSFHNDARRDFYEQERFERERAEIARHEAGEHHITWEQHERWDRAREFNRDRVPYGYNAPQAFYGR